MEKELHSWADPIPQSIKLVLHEQFDARDAGPTGGEVLWVCGSRVGPCGFKLPVYCNLLPYSILDIEYEMTQFAFYYVGIGAAVFLLGYFQVILFLTVTSDVLEILTLVPQIGGIICILSNRSLCGWQLLPNRFSSSGKCTSGKWWGWRSAGSTAPPLASSTLVCQSECSNDDFASGQTVEKWAGVLTAFVSVSQWYQQDQRCHRGSSGHFSAALHYLCVWFLHWLCERLEVNTRHCRSESTHRCWYWSYGCGETWFHGNLFYFITTSDLVAFSVKLGFLLVCG